MKVFPKLLEHLSGPLLAILILIPSLQIGLITDDYRNIEATQSLSLRSIARDLHRGSLSGPHYRPLEPISYRVENFIWKEQFWGYHLTNIIAHAFSAWLISRIAFSIYGSGQVAIATGILFALHPVAAAASGWISGRTSGFACVFLLLSTWLFLKFQATNRPSLLVLSIGTFGMALLTKEQAYLFPVFLLVLLLSQPDSTVSPPNRLPPKVIIFSSYGLLTIASLLIGASFLAWGNEHQVKFYLAAYGITLSGLGVFFLVIRFISKLRLSATVLVWYLVVEACVIFIGFLPSEVLLQETYIASPILFSFKRLSTDLFVLFSTIGMMDFTLRDVLDSLVVEYSWMIGILWVTFGLSLLALLVIKGGRAKILAGLVWLLIALSPMRGLPANLFTISNIYLAVPVIALTMAFILSKVAQRSRYLALLIGVSVALFWGANLIVTQIDLKKMGRFSYSLHSILQHESRDKPGPLRVIVNVPDPARIAQDSDMAHFLVFRIVQSAMQLGGYSDTNVSFVEGRVVQILAVDWGTPCEYEVRVPDHEKIFVKAGSRTVQEHQCLSQLRFVDFTAQIDRDGTALVMHRRPQYSGFPLTEAEVYAFDGESLRLIVKGE